MFETPNTLHEPAEPDPPALLPPPERVDTSTWARREAFEFFRHFDKPYFNVCVKVDVAPLQAWLKAGAPGGLTLALYHLTLRLAQAHRALRLRLDDGQVWCWPQVFASTTVLRADDSLAFAYLPYDADPRVFLRHAQAAIGQARQPASRFDPLARAGGGLPVPTQAGPLDERAALHFTTLPWLHFSSFSHARNWGREDAIPKFAFGRVRADGAAAWLPMSVEVHHGLADGVHVGRFVQDFEAALQTPGDWWPASV
jgi:chloramphenicol O-acetyltransferase type A